MRIYLKGGNGFLGKEIYSKLNKLHEVIIIDRKNYKNILIKNVIYLLIVVQTQRNI